MGFYNNTEENIGGANGSPDYVGLGAAAAKRTAYQTDFSKANTDEQQGWQAHGNQNEAANGLRQAAMGGAPSQAAILGGQVGGQSLQQSMSAGAGARGLGAASAQMQAQQGMGQQQLGAMGQYAGMRGAEMQHAQQSYGQAGGAMRAGDYQSQNLAAQQAEAQARSEMTQRELNQAAQMGYEQMDVRNNQAQSENELRQKGIQSKEGDTAQSRKDQEDARTGKWVKTGISTAATVLPYIFSDERAKQDVTPLTGHKGAGLAGALQRLRKMYAEHEQGGADPADVAAIRGMDPEARARRELHRAMEEGGAGATPYATATPEAKHGIDRMGYANRVRADWNDAGGGPTKAIEVDGPGGRAESRLLGVSGAPEGYHASRAGQVGDVTGGGPEASYDLGFGAGPSGQGPRATSAPGTDDFAKYGAPVDKSMMLSDDKTKLASAQREAFTAGLAHANQAQDTGKFGPVPDYVYEHGKHQPAAVAHKAATPVTRADPAKQNAENAASQSAYDRANAASLAAVPLGWGGTLGALHGTLAEDHMQEARRPAPPPAAPVEPKPSFLSRAPDAMADTLGRAFPSSATGPTDISDENAKQDKHAESDMGRALEQGYKPFEYEYKPGFREQEGQKPGEKNVGPMAQNMAKNSITGNAVEQGDDGLLRISIPKTVKTNSAGIGYLAARVRELDERMKKGGR